MHTQQIEPSSVPEKGISRRLPEPGSARRLEQSVPLLPQALRTDSNRAIAALLSGRSVARSGAAVAGSGATAVGSGAGAVGGSRGPAGGGELLVAQAPAEGAGGKGQPSPPAGASSLVSELSPTALASQLGGFLNEPEVDVDGLLDALVQAAVQREAVLVAYRAASGVSLLDELLHRVPAERTAEVFLALGLTPRSDPATTTPATTTPATTTPADAEPPDCYSVMAGMVTGASDEAALQAGLQQLLTDDARALLGLSGDDAEINLSGNVVYTAIAGISAYIYFSWYYRQKALAAAQAGGGAIDIDAIAVQAKLRAGVGNLEIAPRDFLNFLLTDKAMFRDSVCEGMYKTAVSIGAVEALHHVFNLLLRVGGKPAWQIDDVVKAQRQIASLTLSLLGQARTYLHQQGIVEAPHTGADGKREYWTVEGWALDNGLLWLNLSVGVTVAFGIGEALDEGATITGNIVQRFKPITWKYLPRNLAKGAQAGAKVGIGGMPSLAVEVLLTIMKTTGVADLWEDDHSDPLVQFAQILFSVDDVSDAAIELALTMFDEAVYLVDQLSNALRAYAFSAVEETAALMQQVLFGEDAGPLVMARQALDDMEARAREHDADIAEHREAILIELAEAARRWRLLYAAWTAPPEPDGDATHAASGSGNEGG